MLHVTWLSIVLSSGNLLSYDKEHMLNLESILCATSCDKSALQVYLV